MPKIKILPDTLISQIAAGEVIERPASVVKELVENSLDAGATQCQIEILAGGLKRIAVRDDGCGMSREDVRLACARHATSKIDSLEDLSHIGTFGFRGEALAAIGSCSFLLLRSREKNSEEGIEVNIKGGSFTGETAVGMPEGTEIIVENLFYNTPARRKFMKSEAAEFSHILSFLTHIAAANPHVGFSIAHNAKEIFRVAPSDLRSRLAQLLGKDFFQRTREVFFDTPSLKITGYVSSAGFHAASKRQQLLFINRRDISDALVSRAVADAYGSRLPGRAYPIFFLEITMSGGDVDVNVHPRKMAVKFTEPGRVYRDVSQAVGAALDEMPPAAQSAAPIFRANAMQNPLELDAVNYQEKRARGLEFDFELIGYLADSYILVLDEQGLALIDQHAAHERILFERLMDQTLAREPQTQRLLVPAQVSLSSEERSIAQKALEILRHTGFEIEEWSGDTINILGCPACIESGAAEKITRDVLDELLKEAPNSKLFSEKLLKSLACKAAVKFGMRLDLLEQKKLLQELRQARNNSTCPHGRPTKVLVSFEELERRFGRAGI